MARLESEKAMINQAKAPSICQDPGDKPEIVTDTLKKGGNAHFLKCAGRLLVFKFRPPKKSLCQRAKTRHLVDVRAGPLGKKTEACR